MSRYVLLASTLLVARGNARDSWVKNFIFDPNDDEGLDVQAFAFCAIHLEGEGIDRCVNLVTEKVYDQAPHLRPKGDDDDNNNNAEIDARTQETQLNFALLPGENPYEKTGSFCKENVLPKDVEWCESELLKQVFSQAPDLKHRFGVDSRKSRKHRNSSKRQPKYLDKMQRPRNIARGRRVVASSDEGNYAEAVVDGCKSADDCLVTWTSESHVSRARLSIDLRDASYCIRAVRLFWLGGSTPSTVTLSASSQIALAEQHSTDDVVLKRRNLPAALDRVDRFKCSGGTRCSLDREYLHFYFSGKQGADFDMVELQVFGTKGPCLGENDDDVDGRVKRERAGKTKKGDKISENVLVVVAYDRPHYLKQVLETLRMCEGLEEFFVHIFIDPSVRQKEVEAVARKFATENSDGGNVAVTTHPKHTGPHENIRRAMETAFRVHGATFAIVLEDDVVLSPDALRFMQHAKRVYANDTTVFSVTGYADNCHQEGCVIDSVLERKLSRRPHFTPWFWGTWRDRWEDIVSAGWTGWDVEMNFALTSDRKIDNTALDRGFRGTRTEVFPLLSRANNIGFEGGFHADVFTPGEMKQLQYIHCWASECEGHSRRLASEGATVAFSEMRGPMEIAKAHRLSCSRKG